METSTELNTAWYNSEFWMQEDIKFDFPADLTGIGDRSVHEIYEVVLYYSC